MTASATALVPVQRGDRDTSQRWTMPAEQAPAPRGAARLVLPGITLAALVGYLVFGWVLMMHQDYAIVDALSRSAAAKYVLYSRDPHLAAWGFGFMPLPTILQLPFTLFLEPLGLAEMAGPVMSACCMAGAVGTIGVTCRSLGLRLGTAAAITLVFATNPVVAFYAANGMGEAVAAFSIAVALCGFVGWLRRRRTVDLVLLSFGLAGLVMVRLEAGGVVAVLVIAAALEPGRSWRARAAVAFAIGLPSAYAMAMWLLANQIIMGDPLSFYKALQENGGTVSPDSPWLPQDLGSHPERAFLYGLRWTVTMAPVVIPACLALLAPPWRRLRGGLGLLLSAAVFPGVVAVLLLRNGTYGNPRYFALTVVFAAVAVAWLAAARPPAPALGIAWRTLLVAGLALGSVTATLALSDPVATATEGEYQVFRPLVGKPVGYHQIRYDPWRALSADLDERLFENDGLVLIDARVSFMAEVFSRLPKQFVISSDRDYQPLISDPVGRIDYVLVAAREGGARADALTVVKTYPGQFELVKDYGIAKLYQAKWPRAAGR